MKYAFQKKTENVVVFVGFGFLRSEKSVSISVLAQTSANRVFGFGFG